MAISFDGLSKLIILSATTELSVQDMYSQWVDWVVLSDNMKYLPAIRFVGGDAVSDTKDLGITYFLINGWRIRPMEANHRLSVLGNLYTDPAGSSPFVNTVGNYNVLMEMQVSNIVDTVATGGNNYSLSQIADAVWAKEI